MKEIKAVWGFDHIPDGPLPWNYGLTAGNVAFVPGGSPFTQILQVITYQGRKWAGQNFNTNNVYFSWDIRPMLDLTKKVVMGMRCMTTHPQYFAPFMWLSAAGSALVGNVLGTTLGLSAGTEYYVEMEQDFITGVNSWYVDGSLRYSRTYTAAQVASISTTYFIMYIGGGFTAAPYWFVRDMYFGHCNGADTIDRLGPIDLTPLEFSSVTPPAGSVKPYGVSDLDALVNPPTDRLKSLFYPRQELPGTGELAARMRVPASMRGDLKGVYLFSSTQDRADTPRTLSAALRKDGVTLPMGSVLMANTWKYGYGHGVAMNAPDGSAWDTNKFNSTDVILTVA